MRTNLLFSFSLTHAEGGMVAAGSELGFLLKLSNSFLACLLGEGTVRVSRCDTTISKLPKTEKEFLQRRKSELVSKRDWLRQTLVIQVLCNYVSMKYH